jgi:hypothetical protein
MEQFRGKFNLTLSVVSKHSLRHRYRLRQTVVSQKFWKYFLETYPTFSTKRPSYKPFFPSSL